MNLRRSGADIRIRWIASFALFWGAVLVGCERDNSVSVDRNRPPETYVTQGPEISNDPTDPTDVFYRVHLYWRGEDPDGTVDGFRYAVDDTTDPGAWGFTTKTDSVFRFQAGEVGTLEHLFLIRAVDNLGKQDPSPDTLRFESFTRSTPVVQFQNQLVAIQNLEGTSQGLFPGDTVLVNSSVTFVWSGSDEDGEVVGWQSIFGSEAPVQHARDDTMRTVRNLVSGRHEFVVRAVDDAGAVSDEGGFFEFFANYDPFTVIREPIMSRLRRPWRTGADTLLLMSHFPGDTIPLNSTVQWCWDSTDRDGPIVDFLWSWVGQPGLSGVTTNTCVNLIAEPFDSSGVTVIRPRPLTRTFLGAPVSLEVRGRDIYGKAEGAPNRLQYRVNYPPTVSLDGVPDNQVTPNVPVMFTFQSNDIDSNPQLLRYRWQFDSELVSPLVQFAAGQPLKIDAFFQGSEAGGHTLRLWAQDAGGSESESEVSMYSFIVLSPEPSASGKDPIRSPQASAPTPSSSSATPSTTPSTAGRDRSREGGTP
jgi:hypothetical protein